MMIELTTDGAVARLAIRRAEKKNAMSEAMWRALGDACRGLADQVAAGAAPQVLLVQGEPGSFSAGADIEEMTVLLREPSRMAANNVTVADAQLALERLPLPTVALIDGVCFGGGFGIAAACDFRLGTPQSLFAITPARLGLLYSLEDTRRVVALVGAARAKRLLMRSERLDAATALEWGVLDAVVEADALEAAAKRWAEGLAAQSPASLAGIKATIGHLAGNGAHDEPQIRELFNAAFTGADFAEGAAAFVGKRAPRFVKRG
jgi:enoyl-CoA hydratase/carnithine racemase